MASREEFDYAGYATQRGYADGLPEGALEQQGVKDMLYKEFIGLAYDDYKKQNGLGKSNKDHRATVAALEELTPDARWALDIPEANSREQSLARMQPEAFSDYLLDVAVSEDDNIKAYKDRYINQLTNDEWSDPYLYRNGERSLPKDRVKQYMDEQLQGMTTVRDVHRATIPKRLPREGEVVAGTTAEPQTAEGRGFIMPQTILRNAAVDAMKGLYSVATDEDVRSGFKRSGYTSDMASAASDLFSDEPVPDTIGPSDEMGFDQYTPATPEEIEAVKLGNAQRLVDAYKAREAIPISKNIVDLMEAKGFLDGTKQLSGETLAELVAEGGTQMIRELLVTTAGGIGGAFVGSAVPVLGTTAGAVAGASAAGGAEAGTAAYADHLAQEAIEHLVTVGQEVTAENLVKLTQNADWVAKTKEDATKVGAITGAGTAASTAAGGLINAQAVRTLGTLVRRAKRTKAGVVFQGTTAGQQLAAAGVAATTAGTLDVGTEVAAKGVIGEELTGGELAAVAAMGAVSGTLDLTTGAIAGTRRSGGPTQLSKGDTVYDAGSPNPLTVLDGDNQGITVQESDGAVRQIEIGAVNNLTTERPYAVEAPTPEQSQTTVEQLNPTQPPVTEQPTGEVESIQPAYTPAEQTGVDLVSMHINALRADSTFESDIWNKIDTALGATDLRTLMGAVGDSAEGDLKDANNLLTQGFVDSGAIIRSDNRGYEPAEADNPVQRNMALIANHAQGTAALVSDPTAQVDALAAQAPVVGPAEPKRPVSDIPTEEIPAYTKAVKTAFNRFESQVWNGLPKDTLNTFEQNIVAFTQMTGPELQTLATQIKGRQPPATATIRKTQTQSIVNALQTIQELHKVAPDQFVAPTKLTKADEDKIKTDVKALKKAEVIEALKAEAPEYTIGKKTVAPLKAKLQRVRMEKARALPTIDRGEVGLSVRTQVAATPSVMRVAQVQTPPVHVVMDTSNFIDMQQLEAAVSGRDYKITPILHNDDPDLVSGAHFEKDGKEMITVTSKGNPNPVTVKDRKYTVHIGGKFDVDGEWVGGKALPEYWGGNKNFRIPADIIPVTSPETANDAAFALGLKLSDVERTPNSAVIKRGDDEIKFTFADNGEVTSEVNGVVSPVIGTPDAPIGVTLEQQQTEAQRTIKKIVADQNVLHDMDSPNPLPTPTAAEVNAVAHGKKVESLDAEHAYTPVEGSEDKARLVTGGNIDVQFDGKDIGPDELRRHATLDSFAVDETSMYADIDEVAPTRRGFMDYTTNDVRRIVQELYPPHIVRMIKFHENSDNPAAEMNAWGFFSFNRDGNGPEIHIDAQPQRRDLHSMLSTISEEVAHFSFNSWTTGRNRPFMQKFYDVAWKHYGADAMNDMPHYVSRYDINIDNPDPDHQAILLNEYFSKQGTSIIGFTDDKVSPPAGLNREQVNEIRDAAAGAVKGMEGGIDLTEIDLTKLDNLTSGELAEIILSAQTRGIKPRSTVFTYKDGEGVLTVRPTPFGRISTYRVDTSEAAEYTAVKDSLIEGNLQSPVQRVKIMARRAWVRNNLFGNMATGRGIQRDVTSGSRIDEAATSLRLRGGKTLSRRLEAAFQEKGVSPERIGSYRETFRKHGMNSKSLRKLAIDADKLLKAVQHEPFLGSEAIRNEGAKQIADLRTWAERMNVPDQQIGYMMSLMEAEHRVFRADYATTRYKAYADPQQKIIFREMLQYLDGGDTGSKNLHQNYIGAKVELDRLLASGEATPAKRFKQEQIIEKYTRLEHLYNAYAYQNNKAIGLDNRDQIIIAKVKAKLQDLVTEPTTGNASNGTMKSVTKRTKLDHDAPDDTYDYQMRQFLGEITDPLDVAIETMARQKDVLRQMQVNHKIAIGMLERGAASIVGAPDATNLGTVKFATDQRGTMLEFVLPDKLMLEEVQRMVDMQSEIDTSLFAQFISLGKFTSTVLGLRALMNFYGIAHMMAVNGHIFRPERWAAQLGAVPEVIRQRTKPPSEGEAKAFIRQMVKEMIDGEALGTGLDAALLDVVNNQSVLQQFARAVISLSKPVVSRQRRIAGEGVAAAAIKGAQDFYSFPDELPKILSYVINRDIARLKHESILKREDYPTHEAYQEHLTQLTVREAVDRTRRENTDWAATPDLAKKASHSSKRFLVADFFLHNFQVARVTGEAVRIGIEDAKELKRAEAEGHTEYAAELRTALAARIAGLATIGGAGAYVTATGYTFLSMAINTVVGGADDAYEELTGEGWIEHRASPSQLKGASGMFSHLPYAQSSKYEPFPAKKDKWTWIARADGQLTPFSPLFVPPTPSTELRVGEQVLRGVKQFMLADSDTMAMDFVNAALAKDWKGDQLEPMSKEHWEAFASVVRSQINPGLARQIYETAFGYDVVTGKAKPREPTALSFLGVRTKYIDARDVMSYVGSAARRDYNNRPQTTTMIDALKRGDKSYEAGSRALTKLIARDRTHNHNLTAKYLHFIQSAHRAGYTGAEIREHMRTVHSAGKSETMKGKLSEAAMNDLYAGKNIYDLSTLRKLKSTLEKDVRNSPIRPDWPQERKDRAIKNLEFAITQYEAKLK